MSRLEATVHRSGAIQIIASELCGALVFESFLSYIVVALVNDQGPFAEGSLLHWRARVFTGRTSSVLSSGPVRTCMCVLVPACSDFIECGPSMP
jgi:hypothetical protein